MARARARGRTRGRTKRRADWVYRPNARLVATYGVIDADVVGSYTGYIPAHGTGPGNAQGHVLYDSQNYLKALVGGPFAQPTSALPRAARAEGRNPTILAVEGIVYWEPSTWALGNLMAIGMRLGTFQQSPGTGSFLLDPGYSMWIDEPAGAGSDLSVPALWANNGRGNAWERRIHYGFSDNQAFTVVRVRWRGRRTLKPDECFGLYTELEPTSVNTRTQFWLRTLVADEG